MNTSLLQVFNFNNTDIRSAVHNGQVYWSVIDVVESLEVSVIPRSYWSDLKNDHKQLSDFFRQLKLISSDGKMYLTDCATQKNVFYIMQ